MSSREDTATRCLSVEKVPTELMEVLKRTIGQQTGLSEGNIPVAEVAGYHAEKGVGRFVFLLDYKQSVDRLCDEIKGVTVNKDGTQLNLQYERSTECEIPEEWTKFEAPAPSSMGNMPRRPAVPPKAPHKSQPRPGMLASGFYQNVGQPPGQALGPGPMPQNMRPGMPQPFPPQLYGQGQPGMQGQGPFPQQYQGQPRGPFQQMPVFPRYNPAFMQFGQMGPRGPVRFPRLPVPPKPGEEDKPQGQGEGQYQSGQDFSHMPIPQYFDPQLYQMFAQANFAKHPDEEQPHSGPPPPYNGSIPEQTDHTYNTDDTSQKIREEEHHLSELKEPVPSPRNKENESKKDDIAALTDDELSKQLTAHGMDHVGPIVASTRQVFENKLASLIASGGAPIAQPTTEFGGPSRQQSMNEEQLTKILVRNLPPSASEEFLSMFFESSKRQGGGPVSSVELYTEHSVAIVEFESPDAVDTVMGKLPISMSGHTLEIEIYNPEPEEPVPLDTVEVRGPRDVLGSEMLELYFENCRRSSGGEITEVSKEENVTFITFASEEVAQRVVEKGQHKINNKTIEVTLHQPKQQGPNWQRTTSQNDDDEPAADALCTVKVDGVSRVESMETLQLYFENSRRSGGGTMKEFEVYKEEDMAYMTFEEEAVARRVAERGQHKIGGKSVQVSLYEPVKKRPKVEFEQDNEEEEPLCSIKVTGISKIGSMDTLEYYFENAKRSGGGSIKNLETHEEEDYAYVTFGGEDVAKRVAGRGHKLNNVDLNVSLYKPPKPRPAYLDHLIIKGVNPTTTKDCLFNFLEAKSGASPTQLVYGEQEGTVMVIFDSEPDFEKLVDACRKRPLEKSTLNVSKVCMSNCIIVSNLKSTTSSDTVQFYFENKRRCNGGEIEKVKMLEDSGTCLVFFQDYAVVDDVLRKKHKLEDQELKVEVYIENLGRSQGDGSEPRLKIPDAITIESSLIRKPLHEEKKWIPYEISKLGNEYVALYKQTLEDGEENDYSLRLMIVGPYGVGKTTFTHRLMNDNVTDNEVKSTNGIDVHVRTCEVTLSTNKWKAGKCDTIYKRMVQAILSNKTFFKKSQVSSTLMSVAKPAEVSKESVDSWTISSKQVPMLSKEHRTVPAHSNKAVKTVAKFSDSLNTDETLKEELKRLTNETEESDWSNTDETADVSIWDFGGQSVFYTTHQMFLSHRPVYILMTDISKHSIKTGSGSGRTDKDIVDCLDKWLNSIYGQADPHQEGMPPVIFIGTHADKLKETY